MGEESLSKLGIALTVIFVVSLFALLAQLFYVLWHRRVFRRQTYIGSGADHLSIYSSTESVFSTKEFLFFFCMRSNSNSMAVSSNGDRNSNRRMDMEVVDNDLLKLQEMFGSPRFLFTIKEEEREGFESPADKSLHSAEKKIDELNRDNRVSLEERFKAADAVVAVEIDATPFETPCASPMFLTPSASPDNKAFIVPITEEVGVSFDSR